MGENTVPSINLPASPGLRKNRPNRVVDGYGNPITEQLRIVGQRRREAEEKLDRHLQDARRQH